MQSPKTNNIAFNLTFKKNSQITTRWAVTSYEQGYNLTCRGPNPPFIQPHPEQLSVLPPLAPPIAPNCSGLEGRGAEMDLPQIPG